jgi:predicted RNase H-like HicB family nuclease
LHAITSQKFSKSYIISEEIILHLVKKDGKYFIEFPAKGYSVEILAGKTSKEAELRCTNLIKYLEEGRSLLDASIALDL